MLRLQDHFQFQAIAAERTFLPPAKINKRERERRGGAFLSLRSMTPENMWQLFYDFRWERPLKNNKAVGKS